MKPHQNLKSEPQDILVHTPDPDGNSHATKDQKGPQTAHKTPTEDQGPPALEMGAGGEIPHKENIENIGIFPEEASIKDHQGDDNQKLPTGTPVGEANPGTGEAQDGKPHPETEPEDKSLWSNATNGTRTPMGEEEECKTGRGAIQLWSGNKKEETT